MKKILIIASKLHIGGAEKVCRDIGIYADREKYAMDYVVYGDAVGDYERQVEAAGCRVFHLPEPSEGYPAHLRALNKLMRENRYHAVHVHTMFSCGWAMLVAKLRGVPVRIAHSHSALVNGGGMVKKIYEEVMRTLILTCSTDLVGCGVKAGQRLFGEKAFAKRGQLILNGIDVAAFAYDEEKRAAIRAQLGVGDRLILGHCGHLLEVKNQTFLLDVFACLKARDADAHLVLLGDGQDMDAIRQKAEKLGLSDSISFMGSVANVHEWYQAFDAFVLPSIWEGLPVVGVEAQAADLPCVFSGSVTSEIGMLDKTRFVGLEESPAAWADAIQAALANEGRGDVRSIIAAHGYDISVEAKKLQERYLKMAGEQE